MSTKQKREPRRIPRKDRTGVSPVKAGAVLLALLAVGLYFAFTKDIPFTHGFYLKAVFPSSQSIRVGAPVRIAGVNVGKVKEVKPYDQPGQRHASMVVMQLDHKALPIHTDATAKIRTRIFLEGNFFVDIHPGSPSAPKLESGDVIPLGQTTNGVQLDRLLTAFQSDARKDLRILLQEFGTALSAKPTPAEDVSQDPSVWGLSGSQALNETLETSPTSLRTSALVQQAFLGEDPHDLSRMLQNIGKLSTGLNRSEDALQGLVTSFNATMATVAAQSGNLGRTIQLLAPTLKTADGTLDSLNGAFPSARAFALELIPAAQLAPATFDAGIPWAKAFRGVIGPQYLGGLVNQLRPTTASLAHLTADSTKLLPELGDFSRCIARVIIPTGDIAVDDGPFSTGRPNYQEFWAGLVGTAAESQSFDGNGQYIRSTVAGGLNEVITRGKSSLTSEHLVANAVDPPLGVRPRYDGKRPPYMASVPCANNPVPNVNGSSYSKTGPPAGKVVGRSTGIVLPTSPSGPSGPTGATGAKTSSVAGSLLQRMSPYRPSQSRDETTPAPTGPVSTTEETNR